MSRIGVVVGMRSEASLLPNGMLVGCSGGIAAKAAQVADYMLRAGAEGLISFGVAGGLAPGLAPGALVIGSAVEFAGVSLPSDPSWSERLAGNLPAAQRGLVCGASEAALTPDAKAALHSASGALAIDLESAAMAEVCAAAGKPFAILRAVADPAGRAIPAFALSGLAEDGRMRVLPVMAGLARRPHTLPALLGLARDSRAALTSLGAAARLLGPALGF
jgi:adenosylhomocysteine nucleosidase